MRRILSELGISACVGFLSYNIILSIQRSDLVGMAIGTGIMFFALIVGIDIASDPN